MPNYQCAAKWLVPNLVGGGQTNEKTSPERLACLVGYYDILSNILFIEGLLELSHSLFPDSLSADVFDGERQYLRLGTIAEDVGFRVVAGGEVFPCQ